MAEYNEEFVATISTTRDKVSIVKKMINDANLFISREEYYKELVVLNILEITVV